MIRQISPQKNHINSHLNKKVPIASPFNNKRSTAKPPPHIFSSPSSTTSIRASSKPQQQQTNKTKPSSFRPPSREEAALRAEAEAPFRSIRIVLFGFGCVSAGIASLFALPRLLGSVLSAPNAAPLSEIGLDMFINVAVLAGCVWALKRDLAAREEQISRLLRADALGACQLELANGRLLRLGQLRGFSRAVIIAGSSSQIIKALESAEPFKEQLVERGVLLVPLAIYNSTEEDEKLELPPLDKDKDLKWRAMPIRADDWRTWFDEQAAVAKKSTAEGLYVGLRLDGRVRASGIGCPPWGKFVAQLPILTSGFFQGFLDGMDGRV